MHLLRTLFILYPVLLVTSLSSAPIDSLQSSHNGRGLSHPSRPHEVAQDAYFPRSDIPQIRRDSDAPSAAAEGGHGGRRTIPTTPQQRHAFRIAHGTLMGIAFTIVLSLGAILLRTLPSRYRVLVHASTQLSAYTLIIAGVGLGIWLGRNVRYLDYAHTVIGLVVISMLAIQAALGAWAHAKFRAKGRGGWMSLTHMWLGRTLLALGMINGGIGLMLADNTTGGKIAYGVVAGVMGSVYIAVVVWWIKGRIAEVEKQGPGGEMSESREGSA